MNKIDKQITRAALAFCVVMLFSSQAHAYVDPTTTAMLVQIVAGILISTGLALKIFRRKIFMFFKNLKVKGLQKKIQKEELKNKQRVKTNSERIAARTEEGSGKSTSALRETGGN